MSQNEPTKPPPEIWVPMSDVWNPGKMKIHFRGERVTSGVLRGHWLDKDGQKPKFCHATLDGNNNKVQVAIKDPDHPKGTIFGALEIKNGIVQFTPDDRVPPMDATPRPARRSEAGLLGMNLNPPSKAAAQPAVIEAQSTPDDTNAQKRPKRILGINIGFRRSKK